MNSIINLYVIIYIIQCAKTLHVKMYHYQLSKAVNQLEERDIEDINNVIGGSLLRSSLSDMLDQWIEVSRNNKMKFDALKDIFRKKLGTNASIAFEKVVKGTNGVDEDHNYSIDNECDSLLVHPQQRKKIDFSYLLVLVITAGLSILAISIIAVSMVELSVYPNLYSQVVIADNDTIVLGTFEVSNVMKADVSVSEVVLDGDEAHVNYVLAIPSTKLKTHTETSYENQTIVTLANDQPALDQIYIYMMESSVLHYIICLGNATKPSNTTLYGFRDIEDYELFMSVSIARKPVFQQSFRVGGQGEIVCGNATFTVTQRGYYFMAMKTKWRNTYVHYNTTANLKRLLLLEYVSEYTPCKVTENGDQCSVEFATSNNAVNSWVILGYSAPNYDWNSQINHIDVDVSTQRKPLWNTVFWVLIIAGSGAFFLSLMVCSVYHLYMMVRWHSKRRRYNTYIGIN